MPTPRSQDRGEAYYNRDPDGLRFERDPATGHIRRYRADGRSGEEAKKSKKQHYPPLSPFATAPPGAEFLRYAKDPRMTIAEEATKLLTGTTERAQHPRGINLGYIPRKYFIPFHQRQQRFSCIVAHRRAGKTVGALMDTIHRALKNTSGNARYAFAGPTHAQIKDVVWSYLKQYTYPLPNTRINEAEMSVRLLNGNSIRLYSLDSSAYDRMRGIYLDGITIDEFEDCDPRAMTEVIRPALADRQGWMSVIGTVKGRGALYKLYREAQKDPVNWYSSVFRASETNALPPGELEMMKAQMGYNEYQRELECSFDVEGHDQLISGGEVEEARARSTPRDPAAPVVFGLDVARFGDDRTVVVIREGDRLVHGELWRGKDLMETAARVHALTATWKPRMIFVDGIGVGGGVIDRLRHLGHTNIEDVNVSRKASDDRKYANLRAECYGRLREWIRGRAAIHENFPYAREFEDDLTSLAYQYDARGRLQIQSKDELKAQGLPSPDIADAVSLTFAQIIPSYDVARIAGRSGHPREYYAEPTDLLENW
jgi:hypothetical protein